MATTITATRQVVADYQRLLVNRGAYTMQSMGPHPETGRHYYFQPSEETSVSAGREVLVTKAGDCSFFFGWRGDPFFFDANCLFNNRQFTGDDFFADKNVCSISHLIVPRLFCGYLDLPTFSDREAWQWAARSLFVAAQSR